MSPRSYRGGPCGGIHRNQWRQEQRVEEVLQEARDLGWSIEETAAELSLVGEDWSEDLVADALGLDGPVDDRSTTPTLYDVARAFLDAEIAGTDEDLNEAWLRVKEPWFFEEEEHEQEIAKKGLDPVGPCDGGGR